MIRFLRLPLPLSPLLAGLILPFLPGMALAAEETGGTLVEIGTYDSSRPNDHLRRTAVDSAYFALEQALAELQRLAGPDQRVTAGATVNSFQEGPATLVLPGLLLEETNPSEAARSNREQAYQQFWSNRQPRWTGVWSAKVGYESGPLQGYVNRRTSPAWLISGNELFTLDLPRRGEDASDAPSGYLTPFMAEAELAQAVAGLNGRDNPDGELAVMVSDGSATPLAADGLPGRVVAPKITRPTLSTAGVTSHYAWWVSDESLKANLTLRDPFTSASGPGGIDYRNRLQAPQRFGWELIEGFDTNLAETFINDPRLDSLDRPIELAQLDPAFAQPARENFHSLTTLSQGLLTDNRLGGLRGDLTVFLEGSDPSASEESRPIATQGNGYPLGPGEFHPEDQRFVIDGSRPDWQNFPYSGTGFPDSEANIPTWNKIKSWYENTGDTATPTQVHPATDAQSGVFPMLVYYQSIFGGSVESESAGADFNLHVTPVVVLWNPFDAALETQTYTFVVDRRVREERFSWIPMGDWNTAYSWGDTSSPNYENDGDGEPDYPREYPARQKFVWPNLRFQVTTAFAPGEMIAFTVNDFQQVDFYHDNLKDAYPANHPLVSDADVQETETNFSNYNTALSDVITLTPGWPDASNIGYAWGQGKDGNGTGVILDLDCGYGIDFPAELIDFQNDFYAISSGTLTDNPLSDSMPFGRFRTFPVVMLSENDEVLLIAQQWKTEGVGQFSQNPGKWDDGPGNGDARTGPDPLVLRSDYAAMIAGTFDPAPGTLSGIQDPGLLVLPDNTLHFSPLFAKDPTTNNNSKLNEDLRLTQRIFANHNITSDHAWASPADRLRGPLSLHNEDGMPWMPQFRPTQAGGAESLIAFNRPVALGGSSNAVAAAGVLFPDLDYAVNDYSLESLAIRPVRRPHSEILSLGQLQGANLSPFYHQPMNPIGNAEAPSHIDRGKAAGLSSVRIAQDLSPFTSEKNWPIPNDEENHFLDISYVLNEALWDSYFFSGIPQSGSIDAQIAGNESLPNGRLRFRRDLATGADDARDFDEAAARLVNIGAFNVNSTSVAAWQALLAAFRDLELDPNTPEEVTPFARVIDPIASAVGFSWPDHADPASYGASGGLRNSDNVLSGYRYLTDEMLRELAERIVDEVRLRGPFYSLSDFVNRRLVAPHSGLQGGESGEEAAWLAARNATYDQLYPGSYDPVPGLAGLNGTLQRAINLSGINGGVNYPAGMPNASEDRIFNYGHVDRPHDNLVRDYVSEVTDNQTSVMRPEVRRYLDSEHLAGAPVGEYGSTFSHSPGMLSQADLLSAIGPALTARGDTFLVRTYGDARGSDGETIRVRLEAVVQRFIEPVEAADDPWTVADPEYGAGRRFEIIAVRELSPEDL